MRQLNVYYLDDEEILLEAFADRFSTSRIIIRTFSKYIDLLAAVEQEIPDVVVLDFMMPVKNGVEVAKLLPPSISRILVTGSLDHKVTSGFERVFAKPFPESAIESYFQSKLD